MRVPDGMWDSLKLFLVQCHHYGDVQLCALRLEEVILTAPGVTGVWFCLCLIFRILLGISYTYLYLGYDQLCF